MQGTVLGGKNAAVCKIRDTCLHRAYISVLGETSGLSLDYFQPPGECGRLGPRLVGKFLSKALMDIQFVFIG